MQGAGWPVAIWKYTRVVLCSQEEILNRGRRARGRDMDGLSGFPVGHPSWGDADSLPGSRGASRGACRASRIEQSSNKNAEDGPRFDGFLLYHFMLLLLNCLFNVTINDISVIYVTAHRCAGGLKKKYDLRSGSQRHRHFAGFFNVPVLAPTRDQPFYTVIPIHRPI